MGGYSWRMTRHRWRARLHKLLFSRALSKLQTPNLLWSKGTPQACDFAGPRWYQIAATESVQSETFFRAFYSGASGIVWVRLSTLARDSAACDLDRFVATVLPAISRPFVLITTDGDASVPSDLARDTVEKILANPFLVSWHTQNCDGDHPKLKPFPIGLDLHTPRHFTSPQGLVRMLETIADEAVPPGQRSSKIFCDVNLTLVSQDRRKLVDALQDCDHIDFLAKRIPQQDVWKRYAQYRFALSAAGNGIDCHRTWELLYLGCTVVTKTSPLDRLYDGLPVIIVDDWDEVRNPDEIERRSKNVSHLTDRDYLRGRLRPEFYLQGIRTELRNFELPDKHRNGAVSICSAAHDSGSQTSL
jgi:hypothetical protein